MVQSPQPADGPGGHPEPEPIPTPEPGPPQPIPPPDPLPPPEPPHLAEPPPRLAEPAQLAEPQLAEPTTQVSSAEVPTAAVDVDQPTVSIARAGSPPPSAEPSTDFIDADPPTPPVEFPPVGAYPGEPGHPAVPADPTEPLQPVPMPQTTTQFEQPTPWQQPAPTQAWHAQHEKPGEWRTHPPEHLAWQHSPPAEVEEQTQPVWGANQPPPWQVPLTAAGPPRKRRAGLWISFALTVTLLLCGGGAVSAYFLISNADTGKGAPDPATAVNRFLTAVYTQQDATAADDLVCRDARDPDKLAARVTQIKDYANQYDGPAFRWTEPAVTAQTDERAVVTVQLTMSTDDEKTAQQTLSFTTVHKAGWLVCDVSG